MAARRSDMYRNIYDTLIEFTDSYDVFAVDFGDDATPRFPAADTLLAALQDLAYLADTDRADDGTEEFVCLVDSVWRRLAADIRARAAMPEPT